MNHNWLEVDLHVGQTCLVWNVSILRSYTLMQCMPCVSCNGRSWWPTGLNMDNIIHTSSGAISCIIEKCPSFYLSSLESVFQYCKSATPQCFRPDLVDQGHGHWAKDIGGLNCDWTEDEPVAHSNVLGDFSVLRLKWRPFSRLSSGGDDVGGRKWIGTGGILT